MFDMQLTLSGNDEGPRTLTGKDIVIENDEVLIQGDVVAYFKDGKWWHGSVGYDRFSVTVARPQGQMLVFGGDEGERLFGAAADHLKGYTARVETSEGIERDVRILRAAPKHGYLKVNNYDPETGETQDKPHALRVRTVVIH